MSIVGSPGDLMPIPDLVTVAGGVGCCTWPLPGAGVTSAPPPPSWWTENERQGRFPLGKSEVVTQREEECLPSRQMVTYSWYSLLLPKRALIIFKGTVLSD